MTDDRSSPRVTPPRRALWQGGKFQFHPRGLTSRVRPRTLPTGQRPRPVLGMTGRGHNLLIARFPPVVPCRSWRAVRAAPPGRSKSTIRATGRGTPDRRLCAPHPTFRFKAGRAGCAPPGLPMGLVEQLGATVLALAAAASRIEAFLRAATSFKPRGSGLDGPGAGDRKQQRTAGRLWLLPGRARHFFRSEAP
jgi:hypothetical protein